MTVLVSLVLLQYTLNEIVCRWLNVMLFLFNAYFALTSQNLLMCIQTILLLSSDVYASGFSYRLSQFLRRDPILPYILPNGTTLTSETRQMTNVSIIRRRMVFTLYIIFITFVILSNVGQAICSFYIIDDYRNNNNGDIDNNSGTNMDGVSSVNTWLLSYIVIQYMICTKAMLFVPLCGFQLFTFYTLIDAPYQILYRNLQSALCL